MDFWLTTFWLLKLRKQKTNDIRTPNADQSNVINNDVTKRSKCTVGCAELLNSQIAYCYDEV